MHLAKCVVASIEWSYVLYQYDARGSMPPLRMYSIKFLLLIVVLIIESDNVLMAYNKLF